MGLNQLIIADKAKIELMVRLFMDNPTYSPDG
jgi:hypothetical protein